MAFAPRRFVPEAGALRHCHFMEKVTDAMVMATRKASCRCKQLRTGVSGESDRISVVREAIQCTHVADSGHSLRIRG